MARISFFKSMLTSSSKKQLELENVKQSSLMRLTDYIAKTDCSNFLSYNDNQDRNHLYSILNNIDATKEGRKTLYKIAKSMKKIDKQNTSNTVEYITNHLLNNFSVLRETELNSLLNTHASLSKAIVLNPHLGLYLKSLSADQNRNLGASSQQLLETISRNVNKSDQKEISHQKHKAFFAGAVTGGLMGAGIGASVGLGIGATIDLGLFGLGMGIPTLSSTILGTLGGGVLGSLTSGFSARKYAKINTYENLIQRYKNHVPYSAQLPIASNGYAPVPSSPPNRRFPLDNDGRTTLQNFDEQWREQPLTHDETQIRPPSRRQHSNISTPLNTPVPDMQQLFAPIPGRPTTRHSILSPHQMAEFAPNQTVHQPSYPLLAGETAANTKYSYPRKHGVNPNRFASDPNKSRRASLFDENRANSTNQHGGLPPMPEIFSNRYKRRNDPSTEKRVPSPFIIGASDSSASALGARPFHYSPQNEPYQYS